MTFKVNPSKIMQVEMGFWASKTLLAAVGPELFTLLSNGPKDALTIKKAYDSLPSEGVFIAIETIIDMKENRTPLAL